MQAQSSDQEISVALLIDNISMAKEMSSQLRDIGIFAHFYNDLDEFWVSINTSTPDLCLIDIKKMSQGEIQLKNHPKIKNNTLRYAFFYDQVSPLLDSTFNYNHIGLVNLDTNFITQFKILLSNVEREKQYNNVVIDLERKIENLQKRTLKFGQEAEKGHQFEKKFYMLENLISSFGQVSIDKSFTNQIIKLFSDWNECKIFSLYELNEYGQKLTSPSTTFKGFEQLPDLWLSSPCSNGIENFAQELALEVAYDIFDDNLRILKIEGMHQFPDLIIIGAFVEANLKGFKWEMLEVFLSSQYRQLMLARVKSPTLETNQMNIWDTLNYLDDIAFHQSKAKHKLVGINLNPLINVIKDKHSNRFYWKSFYSDFVSKLSQILSGNFKLAEFGVQELFVFIDQNYLEEDFKKLKAFTEEFSYWKYFEDNSLIMSTDMAIELKLIAPSSVNVIRNIQKDLMSEINSSPVKTQIRQREFPVN